MTQPLVHILTPVFNNVQHIGECIESVLAQTYPNWVYTIVDNCSTDGSGAVARRYAEMDSRIEVYSADSFLPVLANHNRTWRMMSAGAVYGKMLFADDWIFPDYLQRVVDVAESHSTVGIVGAYCLWGEQVGWTGLPYPSTVVSGRDICRRRFLDGLYVFGSATSLLFRADLVRSRDPFYDEQNIHSDSETCHALLKTCDFGFVHQVLTYSRKRPGALSSVSRAYNTYLGALLNDLVRHGADCLNRDELTLCFERELSKYYRYLAKSIVTGRVRDHEFWAFHRKVLANVAGGLSTSKLIGATITEIVDRVLNPKNTISLVLERLSHDSGSRRPDSKSITIVEPMNRE
jgi:glycosyltransferase involved in cell wall biosynthesis